MALPKIGFNEGSLLRRTLLHVGTFLVGSVAFIGLVSFVLVTLAKSAVAPRAEAAVSDDTAEATASATPKVPRSPVAKPVRGRRGAAAAAAAQPSGEE